MSLVVAGFVSLSASLYDILSVDTGTDEQVSTKILPECPRPIKLKTINDNRDVDRYNSELHIYNSCMNQFISKQVELANGTRDAVKRKRHVRAVDDAKAMLDSYNTLSDVDQRQLYKPSVAEIDFDYDADKEAEREKVKAKEK